MKLGVNADGLLEISMVFEPVVIVTPDGSFGVCQRDGGIEVVHQGKIVFASSAPAADDANVCAVCGRPHVEGWRPRHNFRPIPLKRTPG